MARQGKMHSSPFHVETTQYMYAIEHEVDATHIGKVIPDCEFLGKTKVLCNKWNSGLDKCSPYRCMYLNPELQRKTTCESCAFCYANLCFRITEDTIREINSSEARSCCFYFSEKKDPDRFNYIRSNCSRYYHTAQIDTCEKHIAKKNKYIRQAKKEIKSYAPGSSEYTYLSNKIERKCNEAKEIELSLKEHQDIIDNCGGKLTSLPWGKKSRKAKKTSK